MSAPEDLIEAIVEAMIDEQDINSTTHSQAVAAANAAVAWMEAHSVRRRLPRLRVVRPANRPQEGAATRRCCDGTGWTGDPHRRCAEHYVPNEGYFDLARRDSDFFDDYGPSEV